MHILKNAHVVLSRMKTHEVLMSDSVAFSWSCEIRDNDNRDPYCIWRILSNEGLSPSCIDLSFDKFGAINGTVFGFLFPLFYSFHNFSEFLLFRPEYHWQDLISQHAHLVHQNWYRISFVF
jgi:hypothetical protein